MSLSITDCTTKGQIGQSLVYFPYTDTGNAERLVKVYGDRIRYCPEFKSWYVFDGRRWICRAELQVQAMAKQIARALHSQATSVDGEKERKAVQDFARSSESAARIKATLECAKSEKGVAIHPENLDRDPLLLNCQNGTLDLRKFRLRPASPEDLITKICNVDFESGTECPVFDGFLKRIFRSNPRLIPYLQRVLGYCLTGLVSEKAMFFFFGEGNNGKTTLLEAVRYVLGDYAGQVMIESLLDNNKFYQTTAMADLADLAGARFVTTSEADQEARLAEAQIKQLTGMGQLKACRKYENPFTFEPRFKLVMDSNYKPIIRGTESAIWERIRAVPFQEQIPRAERDKKLLEKLKAEAAGILWFAVQGYHDWKESGLAEPPEVGALVQEWRNESDPIKNFIESRCELGAGVKCAAGNLLTAAKGYFQDEGLEFYQRQFTGYLKRLGCTPHRTGSERQWRGIALREAE